MTKLILIRYAAMAVAYIASTVLADWISEQKTTNLVRQIVREELRHA